MLHRSRRWSLTLVASSHELATKLTEHTWTTCTGFECNGWLFLNDSTSADGAQEYAVVRRDSDGNARQYESVTFGWMTRAQAERWLSDWFSGNTPPLGEERGAVLILHGHGCKPQIVAVNEHPAGYCHACA